MLLAAGAVPLLVLALRHRGVLRQNALAVRVGHRADPGAGVEAGTEFQQHVGRTIDMGAQAAAGHSADNRAPFALGVEGYFVMLRQLLVKFGPLAAGLRTRREQGAFGIEAAAGSVLMLLFSLGRTAAAGDSSAIASRRDRVAAMQGRGD